MADKAKVFEVRGLIWLQFKAANAEQAQELATRRERSLSTYRGCEVKLDMDTVVEIEP